MRYENDPHHREIAARVGPSQFDARGIMRTAVDPRASVVARPALCNEGAAA
jgi:hypothetical protein